MMGYRAKVLVGSVHFCLLRGETLRDEEYLEAPPIERDEFIVCKSLGEPGGPLLRPGTSYRSWQCFT